MHTSRKPTQIQRLRRTLGFGSAFTSVLKRLLIRLAFFIRPATDQKMCACPSAFAGTTSGYEWAYRHCEERSDEAIHLSLRLDGLLRGACYPARIRATRWLAMTALLNRRFIPAVSVTY